VETRRRGIQAGPGRGGQTPDGAAGGKTASAARFTPPRRRFTRLTAPDNGKTGFLPSLKITAKNGHGRGVSRRLHYSHKFDAFLPQLADMAVESSGFAGKLG
jgi:hypothetical protein